MSARPAWLTDEMLAEMRRLSPAGINAPLPDGKATDLLVAEDSRRHPVWKWWTNGFIHNHEVYPSHSWLTPAGHKALAAIDAEATPASSLSGKRSIRIGDTVQVTNTKGLNGMDRYIGVSGVVTKVYDYEASEMVLFESGEGLDKMEHQFPWHALTKPCTNCDHGNGPSGVSIFGLRCYTCNGKKVVR